MWKLSIFSFIISYSRFAGTAKGATCEKILQHNCTMLSTCAFRLNIISRKCENLLQNEDTPCSKSCRDSLKNLENFKVGKDLLNCPCETVKCLALRGRFEQCYNGTLQTGKRSCSKTDKKCLRRNRVRNSCSKVDEKCTKNKKCKRKHNKYFSDCHHLIEGYNCTAPCLKSTKRYFDFKLGKYTMRERLSKCQCDGTLEDAIACHAIRRHREKLCRN